ncbi:MAG: 16S rRNA (uracil(1498)-N(3))-methyltransferase [Steroidobacteraceae bacterium]
MRLTRVFVDAPLTAGAPLTLPDDAAAHLTRVLRLEAGDACIVFDGRGGEYPARLARVSKREVVVELGEHDPVERESPLRILLLQGLARGERMDLIVQKATELGVAAIRPVHTLHSGVKLDQRQAERKLEHWRGVAISACEQCQRNRVPEIMAPLPLADALTEAPAGDRWTLSLSEGRTPASASGIDAAAWTTVLIGPEGGLADSEEAHAAAAGFKPLALGPRVLRTETAAIAALAVLGALRGDLAGR